MLAHVLNLAAQFGLGNFAFLDVDNETIVGADETDVQALFGFVPLAANHDAVAVAVRLRTWDDGLNKFWIEAGEALKEVADLFVFDGELGFVRDVLILAAAAIAEVLAEWLNAIGRRREDAKEFGAGETLLHLGDFKFDFFPERDEWNEDDEIVDARDT